MRERRRLVAERVSRIHRQAGRWNENGQKGRVEKKKQRTGFSLAQTGLEKFRLLNFVLAPFNFTHFNYKPARNSKQKSHGRTGGLFTV